MNKIKIGHGSGGKLTRELIRSIFLAYFKSDELNSLEDAAAIRLNSINTAFTTDSYVIRPLFFPGGDIGKLSVCGTVNDLAVSGAIPEYLSLSFIIEEGFSLDHMEEIVKSIAEEADRSALKIVTGDTKVVERGKCDGIYINTAGIGKIVRTLTVNDVSSGDVVIVTGTIGDHGTAVALARNEFDIETKVESDCASLDSLLKPVFDINGVKWMRDPTRGGAATVLVELSEETNLGIRIVEENIPVREDVQFIADMLGYDPLYLANEGKAIIIASEEAAGSVLEKLHTHPLGEYAVIIGEISSDFQGLRLKTKIGGERPLEMLEEDQLPRIC